MGTKEQKKEYDKKYYGKNKRKRNEYSKEYYAKNKAKFKAYREQNAEKIREYREEYYAKNKEYFCEKRVTYKDKHREYMREWKRRNKVKVNARNRAKKFRKDFCEKCGSREKIEFHHTNYERDEGLSLCFICHNKEGRTN